MSHYAQMLPRVMGCTKCGKKFELKKRQMWFHCGSALILMVKESQDLTKQLTIRGNCIGGK